MTTDMVTTSTGTSLQRLAEQSWDRTGAESLLFYEGTRWTGAQLAERARRLTGGLTAAGVRPGDMIEAVNGQATRTMSDMVAVLYPLPPQRAVMIELERHGRVLEARANLMAAA